MIIGGGLSGVLIAEKLAAARLNCLVLEAGPLLERAPPAQPQAFQRRLQSSFAIDEAAWGFGCTGLPYDLPRVRAAGGRSLLWGGWCVRMDQQSLRDARSFEAPWPLKLEELEPYYRQLERRLAIRHGELDPTFCRIRTKLGLQVRPKVAALHSSGLRPFVALDVQRRFSVRPHSAAVRILVGKGGQIKGVEYRDLPSGTNHRICARAVVACASPLESARLLLSSEDLRSRISMDWVGKGLVDHLVASYFVLMPKPAPSRGPLQPLERAAYVPRFVNSGRTHRRDYRGGFILELRGPISLSELGSEDLRKIGVSEKEATGMSYLLIHGIGECGPHPSRFVSLSSDTRDSLGRAVPLVHWNWSPEEPRMARDMEEAAHAIADTLAPTGSRVMRFRDPLRPGGIAHEAGTCRMGRSPSTSVTDPFGGVHGAHGLFVADASVMPTALDRYPTMTVLALALRTADRILDDFKNTQM